MRKLIGLIGGVMFAAAMMVLTPQVAAQAGTCTGSVNHSEFNNIYYAERLSEFTSRANVTECSRTNLNTNPDSYVIGYDANITDIMACVYRVEVHTWRGSDGNLYIRPWKQLRYCNLSTTRYDMTP